MSDRRTRSGLLVGIADHFGWAVAIAATSDHIVVDRRRLELVESGLPAAPIHHHGGAHAMHSAGEALNDDELDLLVAQVRASASRMAERALREIADETGQPIAVVAVRAWPATLPTEIAVLRRPPYESRADSVMYSEIMAEAASRQGCGVDTYDAKCVEAEAVRKLGARAEEVLRGPRAVLGPPWTKDHRVALAATVMIGR